jgi:hypothetical protein
MFWRIQQRQAVLIGLEDSIRLRFKRLEWAVYNRWYRAQTPATSLRRQPITPKKRAAIKAWEERQGPEWRRTYMRAYMRNYNATKKQALASLPQASA